MPPSPHHQARQARRSRMSSPSGSQEKTILLLEFGHDVSSTELVSGLNAVPPDEYWRSRRFAFENGQSAVFSSMSAAFSPIMIDGALVLPDVSVGMIEASAIRRPVMP